MVSVDAGCLREMRTSPLYADVKAQLERLGVPKRSLRAEGELAPYVTYQVSFLEILAPVSPRECDAYLWEDRSIFPGWDGLLALQHAAGRIFPPDAWVIAPQSCITPLVGRGDKCRVLALEHTGSGAWRSWVMNWDEGIVPRAMYLLCMHRR